MTISLECCVGIARPPDVVWAAIAAIESHVEWMADAESITFESEARAGVGTAFICRTRIGPFRTADRMRVTEWAPGEAMGIEHRGVVTGSGRFVLAPATGGTRFCWRERLRFPWWMGGPVGERAAKPILRRLWQRNLERLRTRVERS